MHPRQTVLVAAAAAAFATISPAQGGFAFHLPSNTPATGSCSSVPMGGFISEAAFRSQRTQIVITAAELGNVPRTIHNLAFAPCGSGTRLYSRLQVAMGHTSGPLSTTFDSNYINGDTTVLDRSRWEWVNTADQWNNIGLTRSFDYDPSIGDLLIDITLRNADFTGTDATMRSDSSRTVLHASGFSPTPRTGTLVTTGTKVRVSEGRGYVDDFGIPCGSGPLQLNTTGTPTLGSGITCQLTGGNPSPQQSLAGLMIGVFPNRFSLDQFCTVYFRAIMVPLLPVQSGSSNPFVIPIPVNTALVGGKIYLQGANHDPAGTQFGFATSGYQIVTIGS